MNSDPEQLIVSARAKCREFTKLGYPNGILRHFCNMILSETGNPTSRTWREVRYHL